MTKVIPLNSPNLVGNEMRYLKDCINTNWISTSGKYIKSFESKICNFTGSKYAVACINGTSALQVSLRLVGVKKNDEIIVPTLTFIAPVNAIKYNEAYPIFMDVDEFHNIDIKKTIEFLKTKTFRKGKFTFNKKTKRRIIAIIPVHVWGNASDFSNLKTICKNMNIKIVEDASESLGTIYTSGKFKNKHTGINGDIGCISFNGNKIATTGGGGVILTDNYNLAKNARYLISQAKDDIYNFVHNEVGYNFKLTNIHAALGLAQLEKINFFLKRKKNISKYYRKNIISKNFKILNQPQCSNNNNWMNILTLKKNRKIYFLKKIVSDFKKNKIEYRFIWKANHLQKPYKNLKRIKSLMQIELSQVLYAYLLALL